MSNVDSIRAGYEAFGRGDLDAIRDTMAPDVVWHAPGRSSLAGDHRGIDAVLGYFVALFERSSGTFQARLLQCGEIAPDLVACLVRITGDMPAGPVDQRVMQLFARTDDRTTEVWTFSSDQYAIDEADGPVAIALPDARSAEQQAPVGT